MASGAAGDIQPADDKFFSDDLKMRDPELFKSVQAELGRLQNQVELIASENVVSKAVLEAPVQ